MYVEGDAESGLTPAFRRFGLPLVRAGTYLLGKMIVPSESSETTPASEDFEDNGENEYSDQGESQTHSDAESNSYSGGIPL